MRACTQLQVSSSAFISLVMSAFLGLLALTVVMATFYVSAARMAGRLCRMPAAATWQSSSSRQRQQQAEAAPCGRQPVASSSHQGRLHTERPRAAAVCVRTQVMRTWSVWLGAARGRRGGLPTELGFGGYGQVR